MSANPTSPSPLRAWRKILVWTLVTAAALEGAWLGVFSWSVRSGWLLSLANRRPERVRVEVGRVRSHWPGLIEVDDLHVSGRTRRLDWAVDVAHARAQIEIAALLGRTLRFRTIEATGARVRSAQRETALPDPSPAPAGVEPHGARSSPGPARPTAHAEPPTRPPRWSFDFRNIRVRELTEVDIDEVELRGAAQGDVGFEVSAAAGRSTIHPSRLELRDLEVRQNGQTVGRSISGSIDLTVASWPYRDKQGRALLPYASGRMVLDGELDDRPLLAELLRRAPWIRVEPALSTVSVDLRFDHGELQSGSRIVARRPPSHARILDYSVSGTNDLALSVGEGVADAPAVRWALHFGEFSVRSTDETAPLLTGRDLVLSGRASPPRLIDLAERTELTLELGHANLPDITRISGYLPPSTRLELLSGSADVSGSARLRLADRALSGKLETRFEKARVRWSGLELAGKIDATLALAGGDLEQRRFDISGTRFLLTDFQSPELQRPEAPQNKGWWGDLRLEKAKLGLTPTVQIGGNFQARLRDTSPLVGLFELKHDLPDWASRALTVEDIAAKGRFQAMPGRLEVDDFESGVYGGLLQARLAFAGDRRRGRLLLSWRKLALGVGFEGDERTIKIASAREWFTQFAP